MPRSRGCAFSRGIVAGCQRAGVPRFVRSFLPGAAVLVAASVFSACAHKSAVPAITSDVSVSAVSERSAIPLWPGPAPGSARLNLKETITERSTDKSKPDRIVTGITQPTLTPFVPPRPNGSALIVASGGGYVREVLDKEGSEVARWFAPRGMTVFLFKYRLPGEGHEQGRDVPLQDAQRAVRMVRSQCSQFGVDPSRIGMMGFSAGGHVAASLGARFADKVYDPVDEIDGQSARPDFLILLYPVVSMEEGLAHGGSRRALLGDNPTAEQIAAYSPDKAVGPFAPPTLLILADDDQSVSPENSLRYYSALHRAGVSAEMHIYSQGKHGFGIRAARGMPVAEWPVVAWKWMAASGIVGRANEPLSR
ncbi:MAG TPA: alpha/beta hydrolase [Polyangiaceae bacterium]